MTSKAHWLDRTLLTSPVYFGLCLSEAAFRRELKRLGISRDDWPQFCRAGAGAVVHHFENSAQHGAASLVCMPVVEGCTVEQVYAVLVHEAVHIWQRIREELGERFPSNEFEAYSIQHISQQLMMAYRAEVGNG